MVDDSIVGYLQIATSILEAWDIGPIPLLEPYHYLLPHHGTLSIEAGGSLVA
jgi:hypothetical protein